MTGHGQLQYIGIGRDAATPEQLLGHQCDGQHHGHNRQQIERKQPVGHAQIPLILKLHHRHMKLPRQADNRQHG